MPIFKIIVHGINTEDGASSIYEVLEIINSRTLIAFDNDCHRCTCTLIGQLNRLAALKNGFQPDLISHFQSGFPQSSWKKLLEEHVQSVRKQELSLVRWRISLISSSKQSLTDDFKIHLHGIRTDTGDPWTSAQVSCVLGSSLIQAGSHIYKLIGRINAEECIHFGFSHHFIEAFLNGFPENWKILVTDHIALMKQAFVRKILFSLHKKSYGLEDYYENNDIENNYPIIEEIDENQLVKKASESDRSNSSTRNDDYNSEIVKEAIIDKKSKKNLNNTIKKVTENQAVQLRYTKRGRMVKPRINSWLGERLVYDVDGNLIQARLATTMHADQNESQGLLAISTYCGITTTKSQQYAQKPLIPLKINKNKSDSNRTNAKRDNSVDSYTRDLDQIEIDLSESNDSQFNKRNSIKGKNSGNLKAISKSGKGSVMEVTNQQKSIGSKKEKKENSQE